MSRPTGGPRRALQPSSVALTAGAVWCCSRLAGRQRAAAAALREQARGARAEARWAARREELEGSLARLALNISEQRSRQEPTRRLEAEMALVLEPGGYTASVAATC